MTTPPIIRGGVSVAPITTRAVEGWIVNHKKLQRIWREEGLRVPVRRRRKRLGTSTAPDTPKADAPNRVWAVDFQFDSTTDGRPVKIASIIDEHTRECLGGLVARSITGDDLIDELDRLAGQRGYPAVLRCDNGPELACAAMADWAGERLGLSFIQPGQPWRNGYVESFNSRVRDECLNINLFWSLTHARVVISDWKTESTSTAGTQPWATSPQPDTLRPATTNENQTTLTNPGLIHGVLPDPLYGIRRVLRTGAELLTDRQHARLTSVFAADEHITVEATWGIYQRIVAAYRHPDRSSGKTELAAVIEAISRGVPTALTELIRLGHTLKRRSADVLAYFDRPGTSNGPTEAINGRLEHLRGTALGFRNLANYITRSLLDTGGFRPRIHPLLR